MLTISYDETTGFERYNRDKKAPTMIAGMVYEDESDILERERICAYLRAVCREAGEKFPLSLHSSDSGMGESEGVGLVKSKINKTLVEFFQYGTYGGETLLDSKSRPLPERLGQYQILVLAKRWDEESLNESYEGKLYTDMAERFVERAVFSNLLYLRKDHLKAAFNVPTRVIPNPKLKEQKEILKRQGFAYKEPQNMWSIVDAGSVKGWISKYNTGNTQGNKILPTYMKDGSSIFTEPMKVGYNNEKRANEFAFMFLADALCSYLKDRLYIDAKQYFEEEKERTAEEIRIKLDACIPTLQNTSDANTLRTLRNQTTRKKFSREMVPALEKVQSKEAKEVLMAVKSMMPEMSDEACDEKYFVIIRKKLQELCSVQEGGVRQSMFYYFDAADDYFDEVVLAADRGDIFMALSKIYDGMSIREQKGSYNLQTPNVDYYDRMQVEGDISQYYKENWFSKLERWLTRNTDKADFETALLAEQNYRLSDNVSQGKLLYIFQKLEEIAENLQEKAEADSSLSAPSRGNLFDLYDIGISAYTHIGDSSSAEKCYLKCFPDEAENERENAGRKIILPYEAASDEAIALLKNRMITVYNDEFAFEKAEKTAKKMLTPPVPEKKKETMEKQTASSLRELLKNLFRKKDVVEQETVAKSQCLLDRLSAPTMKKTSYKIWSSLAQVCAFENSDETEECFHYVLDVLAEEKSADYYITLSYLLHWYVECGDREGYEKWAKKYFGGHETPDEQLDDLIKEGVKERGGRFSFKYALFVFVKAFYKFYKDEEKYRNVRAMLIDMECKGSLKDKVREHHGQENLFRGHPWEIIYKYVALLALDADYPDSAEINIKKSKDAVGDSGFTVNRIVDFGNIEFCEKKMEKQSENDALKRDCEELIEALWEKMQERGCVKESAETATEKMAVLQTKFTYMYH